MKTLNSVTIFAAFSLSALVYWAQPGTVEVQVEVEKIKEVYIEVPVEYKVEVPVYYDRPILVVPNVNRHMPSLDWDKEMLKGVKFFEGFKPNKYLCCAGVGTIGYGCTDKSIVNIGTLSKTRATQILEGELVKIRQAVSEEVKVPLTENQLNALTSFAFNCGMGNLKRLVNGEDRLNSGNYKSVALVLPQYRLAGGKVREGLVKRRAWELSMWQGEPSM